MTNKSRLLMILKYLQEQTDDNYSVSSAQLQQVLASHGCDATTRTIRDDIAILAEAGFDIIAEEKPGMATRYHLGERVFERPELQILIDAVSSSRFISNAKSRKMIDTLVSLGSRSDAPILRANHLVAQKVKADNSALYYVIELIEQAIEKGRRISFQYETYGPDLTRCLRHGGETYVVSPYTRVWSEDRYYLVGWSEKHGKVVPFRIDLMRIPTILDEAAAPVPEDFDVSEYGSAIIRMFGGEMEQVTFSCDNGLAGKLVDRFGTEQIHVLARGTDAFTAAVQVSVGPTFYGWLLQYGGGIRVLAPESVRAGYSDILRAAMDSLR